MTDETDDNEQVDGTTSTGPGTGGVDPDDSTADDAPIDGATPGGGPDRDRRRTLVIAASVIATLVLAAAVIGFTRSGTPVAEPTTTTTSKPATSTTSTTQVRLPANTVEIATVKSSLDRISIRSEPPAEWDTSTPAAIAETHMELPPASSESAPERPAIPTEKAPVTGRYAVDGGWEFSNPGPLDPPQPMTFLVTERRGNWAQVMLPVRPNGTLGYLDLDDVDLSTTTVRVEVQLGEHTLRAYSNDELVVESPIVAGVNFSPTPTGTFYLTDIVPQKNADGFYGPYVLATNGYSEMLNEFDNGVPVIAIHGTNNPSLMGQDKSNGCIRVPNEIVGQLAETMPAGTPILIWP